MLFAEDCRLQRVAAVDFVLTSTGGLEIPVEINGIHVRMAVEAGSGLTAIWSGATAGLNLQAKETIRRGILNAGNTPLTQTAKIDSFSVGGAGWAPMSFIVYPRSKQFPQTLAADDVVGFLGQDVFANLDVELDFGAHQLRLYSQKHCPGEVVYWAPSYDVLPLQRNALGNLFMSMSINGKLVMTSLSTRSSTSTLEQAVATQILGSDRTDDGSDGCAYCRSITLKAKDLEIRNARVTIVNMLSKDCRLITPLLDSVPMSYSCMGGFPLRLGTGVLSKLHLYFANGEKKLYFTPETASAAEAPAKQ